MSLNSIMNSSLSGMYLARAGLQTTSHNISNAGTAGFSRQELMVGSRLGASTSYGYLGDGAEATGVRRMTDFFLVGRMRSQGARLTYYSQMDTTLYDIETVMGSVDGGGVSSAINDFFSSWNDLATPPANDVLRQSVLHSSQRLAEEFNNLATNLNNLADDLDSQIESGVGELNARLEAVAILNQQILTAEAGSSIANDLRDQRELLLGEVAALTDIDVQSRNDGTVDVIINGRAVVVRNEAELLTVRRDEGSNGEPGRFIITAGNRGQEISVGQGHISALLESRDENVLGALDSLNEVAATFIDKINELHVQGETHNGHGVMFFTGTNASNMQINTAVENDPNLIATSRDGFEGDTDLAKEIAAMSNTAFDENGNTLGNIFTGMIVDFASRSGSSQFMVESQMQVVSSLENRIESLRGVSMDEEAANMSRYQNAYDASARMVSVVQEMFDTLFQMV
ncbi:MAG: flagellar hook-associated protein FlgK [bacterium]|nr:flagellar hook-associated protein FlgK [bacterium]MCP4800723.1 flagellar hook-associated protein FlgK [bacterium]